MSETQRGKLFFACQLADRRPPTAMLSHFGVPDQQRVPDANIWSPIAGSPDDRGRVNPARFMTCKACDPRVAISHSFSLSSEWRCKFPYESPIQLANVCRQTDKDGLCSHRWDSFRDRSSATYSSVMSLFRAAPKLQHVPGQPRVPAPQQGPAGIPERLWGTR